MAAADPSHPARWLPLVGVAVLSAVVYTLGPSWSPGLALTTWLPLLSVPLFAGYLLAGWWVWRHPGLPVTPIVLLAVVLRLCAVASGPPALSSDSYRYAWDARVQHAGISPYAHPPQDEALAHLRDGAIHPNINRPWARTVYPPGAQVLYRIFVPFDIDGLRVVMVGFDTLTLLLLVRLLRRLGQDPARVVMYAWCPLVVYEIGQNGHVEAMFLPLLVGAALASHGGRDRTVGLWVGVAASIKLYPMLAGVVLARRHPVRVLGTAGAVVAGLYAAYGATAGAKVLGFLPEYVGVAEDHNIGLRRLIEAVLPVPHAREIAFGICVLLLGLGCVALWRTRGDLSVEEGLSRIAGLYLLTLPTALHPWYALWLVPWLCIRPRASWLWLVGALPFSYLKYAAPGGVMPGWVVPLELVPVVVLLLWEEWTCRRSP